MEKINKNKSNFIVFKIALVIMFTTIIHSVKATENSIISILDNNTTISFAITDNLIDETNYVDYGFPSEINNLFELQIVANSSAIKEVTVDYYISVDVDISADDIHFGSQLLVFDEENLSTDKIIRFAISNNLIEVPFYLGACLASFIENNTQVNCTKGIMVKLNSTNSDILPEDNIFINWLDEIEIIFI